MAKKSKKKKEKPGGADGRVIASNRRARHDFTILDTYEAGIALVGPEVKSLRDGKVSMAESFAIIDKGEVWLHGLHIPEYSHGSWTNHAPKRVRKLLLHRREIDTLIGKVHEGKQTLVPLSMYFSGGRVKVDLALARGKQLHDKREAIRRRTAEREVTRELGRRVKGMRG